MLKRLIKINYYEYDSFFLWGGRQTGKSTLLKHLFPDAIFFNLLDTEVFANLTTRPARLREEIRALPRKPDWVVIDEIQKIPNLLNEVHLLIEEDKIAFALCGSSARKVKNSHANLLGGRALRYELSGLSLHECDDKDLVRILNTGYLPRHWLNPAKAEAYLRSYVADYLKEEIAAEGLVRNLANFSNFLNIAALSDGEIVNFSTIARDVGVSSQTVKDHFNILVDTLLGYWVPAWSKRIKRRTIQAAKFYFDDVGVVNQLAKRKNLLAGSAEFGKAFENWVFHELHAWNRYYGHWEPVAYWRLSSGIEVDFIWGDMQLAIEAKASQNIHADHLRGLRQLAIEFPEVKKRIVVSLEKRSRITDDGIHILAIEDYLRLLWQENLGTAPVSLS